jgi:hypothetical protein
MIEHLQPKQQHKPLIEKGLCIVTLGSLCGFEGLVKKHFSGNHNQASQWVADLGAAAYYYPTKPYLAINRLKKWYIVFPHLFVVNDDGKIVDIAWKSEWLRNSRVF